jgi:nitrogen regulatory protein P-II 1
VSYLVTAVIKPYKLEEVKDALRAAGIRGMTASGAEYQVSFVPKVKIEVLVADGDVDRVIEVITTTAHTGKIGDGKIWAYEVGRLARVRTGETGDDAL